MIKWIRRSVSHSLFHVQVIPESYCTRFELTYNFYWGREKRENSKRLYVGETLDTADCKDTEWFSKSCNKFLKPTNPSILNTKSPYVFECGCSIKPAMILLRRETHLNTLPNEKHICLAN